MNKLLITLLSLLILPIGVALGQAEDVIVISELTEAQVNEQIIAVETDLYAMFNAQNTDKNFNIECRQATFTGTHMPERVCEPVFLTMARVENNRDFVEGLSMLLSADALREQLKVEFDSLNEQLARLAKDNQQFAELRAILNSLRLRLNELKNS